MQGYLGGGGGGSLTSGRNVSADELLPLLIASLILVQLRHLASVLFYVRNFFFSADWKGRAGFLVRHAATTPPPPPAATYLRRVGDL